MPDDQFIFSSSWLPSSRLELWTLASYNNIWRKTEPNIQLFADDCIIYKKIMESSDIDKLQRDLNRLGEWAVENEMKINPGKSKAVSFTKARVKEQIRYYFGDQLILEASSFKYLGIIIRSDLNLTDHVNYTPQKAWKDHFIMRILKKRNNNMKRFAYMALVTPILEYGAMYWDSYREGQESALNHVQKTAAKFANNTNELGWETLAQRRLIARICTLVKAHTGRRAWNVPGKTSKTMLSRDDHNRKIRTRKQMLVIFLHK